LALSGEPFIKEIENVLRPGLPVLSINEVWELQLQKTAYQKKVLEVWGDTATRTKDGKPIDAFIMPIAPYAAVVHGQYGHVSYTSWINAIDYPSCVVPVTFADKNIDKKDDSYTPIDDVDKDVWEKYDPEVYHGGPVAVQVVGRRLREEQTLEIAEIVSNTLPPIK